MFRFQVLSIKKLFKEDVREKESRELTDENQKLMVICEKQEEILDSQTEQLDMCFCWIFQLRSLCAFLEKEKGK